MIDFHDRSAAAGGVVVAAAAAPAAVRGPDTGVAAAAPAAAAGGGGGPTCGCGWLKCLLKLLAAVALGVSRNSYWLLMRGSAPGGFFRRLREAQGGKQVMKYGGR
ncbi:hypothetical protein PLESTB_001053800 [Pleodorina starrii]|uniref:Uncharacterized protein n=1 Tax=Pleodorina starrii TaxID=330485 RepID=A0A9W6BR25_9CHLO|nr:hypothetical protein PLESTM_001272100 [Pleodorina starrii]GLC56001.1 hypothetical protein PLESTB_001053800 [Pleodorina starrii]GLC63988.1 hypothetical protein PLESTF_000106300 [Pleodorina starrii]